MRRTDGRSTTIGADAVASSANDDHTRGLGHQVGRERFPARPDIPVMHVVVIHNQIMCDHPTVAAEFCAARDVADTALCGCP